MGQEHTEARGSILTSTSRPEGYAGLSFHKVQKIGQFSEGDVLEQGWLYRPGEQSVLRALTFFPLVKRITSSVRLGNNSCCSPSLGGTQERHYSEAQHRLLRRRSAGVSATSLLEHLGSRYPEGSFPG